MAGNEQILRLRPRGLVTDAVPADGLGDFFYDIENIAFRDGAIRQVGLDSATLLKFGTPKPNDPQYLLSAIDDGQDNYHINVISDTGSAGEIITVLASNATGSWTHTPAAGLTSTEDNNFTGGNINGFPFFTNSVDQPFYWDRNTANNFAPLTGWFGAATVCGAMRAYDDFLVGMDFSATTGGYDAELRWSDRAAPGAIPTAWTATATNEAGSATVSDTPGGLVDGRTLGNGFMLYKYNSAYLMTQTGLPEVMTIRKVFDSLGVMARNCIQEFNGFHYVAGQDDVYIHDGRRAQSLMSGKVRRDYEKNVGVFGDNKVYTSWNPKHSEFWVVVNQDLAYIWNGDNWGKRDIGKTDRWVTNEGDANTGMPYIGVCQYGTSSTPTITRWESRMIGCAPGATSSDERVAWVEAQDGNYGKGGELNIRGIIPNPDGTAQILRIYPIYKNGSLGDGNIQLTVYGGTGAYGPLGGGSGDGTSYTFDGTNQRFVAPADNYCVGYEFGLKFTFDDYEVNNNFIDELSGFDVIWASIGKWNEGDSY